MHDYVNLGSIESAIALVVLPRLPVLVQSRPELRLSLVPLLVGANVLFWSCREVEVPGEPEESVYMVKELETTEDLLLDLVSAAKDVSIVLLEPSHASQPGEGPADLIAMEDAEVSVPNR